LQSFKLYLETGSELVLTEVKATDLKALCLYANDPEIYRYTENIPYPFKREDGLNYLAKVNRAEEQYHRPVHFAIRDKESGEFAGAILRLMTSGMEGIRDEIGYWLGKPWRGKNQMADCIRVFCAYWFAESPLVRITAIVHPDNQASIRVLEKSGFEQEGFFRNFLEKDGELIDVIQMVLLQEKLEDIRRERSEE
jgi:RimJ/RimL family protein N-acetyltransferase